VFVGIAGTEIEFEAGAGADVPPAFDALTAQVRDAPMSASCTVYVAVGENATTTVVVALSVRVHWYAYDVGAFDQPPRLHVRTVPGRAGFWLDVTFGARVLLGGAGRLTAVEVAVAVPAGLLAVTRHATLDPASALVST